MSRRRASTLRTFSPLLNSNISAFSCSTGAGFGTSGCFGLGTTISGFSITSIGIATLSGSGGSSGSSANNLS